MVLDEDYKNGIIWQDIQHQRLLSTIKSLANSAVAGRSDKELFYKTIYFLKEYISCHFATEELYMTKYGYPGIKNHLEEHHLFIEDFKKFISQSIYSAKESATLLNSLNVWFVNHIKGTDRQLAKFLLDRAKI